MNANNIHNIYWHAGIYTLALVLGMIGTAMRIRDDFFAFAFYALAVIAVLLGMVLT